MTVDISVEGLYYAYPAQTPEAEPVPVLQDIRFQVARGESVALLGRVGAGKSTLCMALNGLVPHATGGVFRGDITVVGHNTKQHAVADLSRFVGMVFQDPESQLVQMRVEDEVAFGLENLGVPSREMEDRVTWALEAVGLAGYRDRTPLLLSGGEKQRLAIAAMLAMRPRVLVLDEPTASLDPAGKVAVFQLLDQLRRAHDLTVFMATQELERLTSFDRVLVLHQGTIVLDGPPAQILRQVGRLQELGIGVPQLAELSAMLERRTGRPYYFANGADAYQQLRQQMQAAGTAASQGGPPAVKAPRPHPLADRSLVALENVSYVYSDGTPALHDINLTVRPGDFIALLGPNGAGKSTLARHMNGLLRPSSGRVRVDGRDTRTEAVASLARNVAYAFQNPDHQIFAPTVEEEIAFGLRMQELPAAIVARRVAEMLDRFRLVQHAHTPPALLGFGQRRKVALAAILGLQPQVLILDEPTGGLDWQSWQELMSVVAAFHAMGRTVALITHDMHLVAEYATRAVVLLAGRILFDGPPRQLFKRPDILAKAQLAVPPVAQLAQRLQGEGFPVGPLTCAEFATAWLTCLSARRVGEEAQAWDAQGSDGHESRI